MSIRSSLSASSSLLDVVMMTTSRVEGITPGYIHLSTATAVSAAVLMLLPLFSLPADVLLPLEADVAVVGGIFTIPFFNTIPDGDADIPGAGADADAADVDIDVDVDGASVDFTAAINELLMVEYLFHLDPPASLPKVDSVEDQSYSLTVRPI